MIESDCNRSGHVEYNTGRGSHVGSSDEDYPLSLLLISPSSVIVVRNEGAEDID